MHPNQGQGIETAAKVRALDQNWTRDPFSLRANTIHWAKLLRALKKFLIKWQQQVPGKNHTIHQLNAN